MSISAMGPCPCPRLIMCSRSPGAQPFFSAKRCNMDVGSAPVDRMKMHGVPGDRSLNTCETVPLPTQAMEIELLFVGALATLG